MSAQYNNARLLVELAAVTAYHGDAFLRSTRSVSSSGIESYWLASRNRLDAWAMSLKHLEERVASDCHPSASEIEQQTQLSSPLVEEILASEVLTRIWTAIGCEIDRRTGGDSVEPFVRSILIGHLDTRHRLLRLVFNRMQLDAKALRRVDRMRRATERWTDVLLGYLVKSSRVGEFAFDSSRMHDFAHSLNNQGNPPEAIKSLLMASLRSTFQSGFVKVCPNGDLNATICESVLSCFSTDLFDSTGQFRSLWELRLSHATKDTLGMIDCLKAEHDSVTGSMTDPRAS